MCTGSMVDEKKPRSNVTAFLIKLNCAVSITGGGSIEFPSPGKLTRDYFSI